VRVGGSRTRGQLILSAGLFSIFLALAPFLEAAELLRLQNVLVLALLACATNLLVGYGGLVSFGQGAFFGLGAYVVALGWRHYDIPYAVLLLLAPLFGAVLAAAIGAVALRIKTLYFALVTLGFGQLLVTLAQKSGEFTGGDNGMFGPMIPEVLAEPRNGYLFVLLLVSIALLSLWKIVDSPFGLALRATRENRDRAEALGINTYWHQLLTFIISGAYCGLAGGLIVIHEGGAYPSLFDWTRSTIPVIGAVIGGMFAFLGPALGAFVFQYGHDVAVQYTQRWQLVLGVILLAIVLVAPDGLVGLFSRARDRLARSAPRSFFGSRAR
jgi:branched-chain amino acid transport system permease protein